ncbi:MAG: hypothetical protein JWS10_2635 [Cypionkella sp.]|uniref:hypothetical protein n=1 Tax=Cypionkella sp. TaxID=2811411 RepID=UPI00260CF706|nr:hypothetical protein [Cypionkella sp.]MDB5660020.1 hypothetical protein [Cypionkella sp.]MDB5665682.1 hypothetical protein [Cypionkella sp.]
MIRNAIAGFLLSTALVFPALAQDMKPIREVEVTVDTAGIGNAQAATYWGTLQDDLKAAILTKVAPSQDEAAYVIKIRIDDVSLTNGFQEKLGLGDTTLSGNVLVQDDKNHVGDDAYDLTVDVNAAKPLLPEGYDFTAADADSKVYYNAMVNAFADGVVTRLK